MITRYLVSYDIADPDRLRKVHGVVKTRAQHIQDSLYEALLTETERVRFEARLEREINKKEDQVMFINLGSAERKELPEITTLGLGYQPHSRGSIVL
jgi:CRISPR-associated protein Cas2